MVINYLIVFLAIFVAVLIAQSTSYGVLIKILIAYVALEAMLVVLGITQDLLGSALNRLFFFFIDVVPAHGANAAQAKAIVFMGRYFELSKKLENDIKNFTYEDALELNSQLNWRARLLFPSKERLLATVGELKRIYGETGQQPRELGELGIKKVREGLPGGKISLLEQAIVHPSYFNSIFGFCIIALFFTYAT